VILKPGDDGVDVEQLQLMLKAAGYDPGDIDGNYGKRTTAMVLAFQLGRPDIDDDGVAGPQTLGALNAAVGKRRAAIASSPLPANPTECNEATWAAFMKLIDAITKCPVRYGPGRGLWVNDRFVITYGAGKLGGTTKQWPNVIGKTYPAFHCTSWCNFFMSWLCRRNQDFTPAGNCPSLFDLLEKSSDVQPGQGAGPYRGFGEQCFRIPPDGSGSRRLGIPNVIDMRELYERRDTLPTFIVWGQSTRGAGGWNWWHHTGVCAIRDHKLYRIAADGSKGASGYSGKAMQWLEITASSLKNYTNIALRPYGVRTLTGSYGDPTRPISRVDFEA
jgi:hypothetical protein